MCCRSFEIVSRPDSTESARNTAREDNIRMLESLRSFDENPRHGGEVQLSRQAALARIGMAGRLTPLGENRLLDEVEPVGEFDLFWNGTSTDPSPDFAENRTLRCEEHFEVKTAVIRGQGILQNRPGQS